MTDPGADTGGAQGVHHLCTGCAPAAHGVAAMGATGLAICAALRARPALADAPGICDSAEPGMAGLDRSPGVSMYDEPACEGFHGVRHADLLPAFPAAPRRDGRVTEVTFNRNLNFEGLTRLRVSCQPLRDHTRDLMQVEVT